MATFKKFKVKKANAFMCWLFSLLGMVGWTSAWGVIYIRPDQLTNQRLIAHEQAHAMQLQRDGRVWQPIKYAYYLLRYGYKNNPYEVEARAVEKNST